MKGTMKGTMILAGLLYTAAVLFAVSKPSTHHATFAEVAAEVQKMALEPTEPKKPKKPKEGVTMTDLGDRYVWTCRDAQGNVTMGRIPK